MKFIKVVFVLTLIVLFAHHPLLACRCYNPPPPCYEYSQSDVVFVGTVKEIKWNENSEKHQITLAVDKGFKGIETDLVYTETGGYSCDFEGYKENRKLLIYGEFYKDQKNFFLTNYCSRSHEFSENSNDLEFLNKQDLLKPNYLIWGTVSSDSSDVPIKGIKALVLNGKKKLTGISDKNGDIKIAVTKEGKYIVRVYQNGGEGFDNQGYYNEYQVEVKNNQCGWFNISL